MLSSNNIVPKSKREISQFDYFKMDPQEITLNLTNEQVIAIDKLIKYPVERQHMEPVPKLNRDWHVRFEEKIPSYVRYTENRRQLPAFGSKHTILQKIKENRVILLTGETK